MLSLIKNLIQEEDWTGTQFQENEINIPTIKRIISKFQHLILYVF